LFASEPGQAINFHRNVPFRSVAHKTHASDTLFFCAISQDSGKSPPTR
jgi:hypothetical protein